MKTTRRGFLSAGTATAMAMMAVMPRGMFAQSGAAAAGSGFLPETMLAGDPQRPQFHLLPARNWMNDPNGPIYIPGANGGAGTYHMFFQYNPLAAVWGDMSWDHAVSSDMLHWRHDPVAMTPTPGSVDAFGVFSGSAIAVMHGKARRVYAVYTGTQKSDDAHATIRDGANDVQEQQCLAWSDDAGLVRWTKDPKAIVPVPPEGMKITGFRDPSVWRSGGWYYMTVGSGEAGVGGCVLLYRSAVTGDAATELRQWEYMHKLTSGAWNGKKTANPCDDGEMWECPEFFALGDPANGGGHVLIYSTLGKVFWQSGALDERTMTFAMKKTGELDLGAFYAPKTQMDAQGRRILWGWVPEKRSEAAMKAAGWSGMMALPRVMSLDGDGTLRLRILPGASVLRAGALKVEGVSSGVGVTLPAANGEVVCSGVKGKSFTLRMSGAAEIAKVEYVGARHAFVVDSKEIALQAEDVPRVHAFVDGSVVEMILGERIGVTKRFYAEGAAAGVSVLAESEGESVKMEAWRVAAISKDRLTT